MRSEFVNIAGEEVAGTGASPCNRCTHRHSGGHSCDAFPLTIPIEILAGDERHERPRPDLGQMNGVVFEAVAA